MLKHSVRRLMPHPVFRAIRKRRVAREIRRYEPRLHRGRYNGHSLELRFEDGLAEGWYGHDYTDPEAKMLSDIGALRDGARVFDLGAHQAVIALILAREVGPSGQVIAVEAEPHNARVAAVNRDLNHAGHLEIVHAAVTDREGSVTFAEGLNGRVDQTTAMGNVEVPATTVNALCARYGRPDVVFMDIEGYEGIALRAAGEAMGAAWAVEVHVEHLVDSTAREIVERFDGWERWVKVDDQFEPFTGEIPDQRFFLVARPARGR